MTDALGMIETRSFPAVIEAADAAVKAARVELVSYEKTGGGYTTIVDTNNPGPRPARSGGPYAAQYLLTGETPTGNNWRSELARIVTSDKQFARATVNYIWAHFFRYGIVDPPDG